MTNETTYIVSRLEGLRAALPIPRSERDCVLRLSEARWELLFRDGGRGISGSLMSARLSVESAGRRRCRVTIEDPTGDGFTGTAVIHPRAAKVQRDLDERLAALERAGEIVAEVAAGSWWLDDRVFAGLDWSKRCSVAGVRYRAGWWGTGRLQPSMLSKVLDFGSRGVVLRGWRTRLVIPWDAIASIRVYAGDCWAFTETAPRRHHTTGTTVVIRSLADQDAVFYTPLVSMSDIGVLLAPLVAHLPMDVPVTV